MITTDGYTARINENAMVLIQMANGLWDCMQTMRRRTNCFSQLLWPGGTSRQTWGVRTSCTMLLHS